MSIYCRPSRHLITWKKSNSLNLTTGTDGQVVGSLLTSMHIAKVISYGCHFLTGFKFNCRAAQTLSGIYRILLQFSLHAVTLISIHLWQDTQLAGVAIILSRSVPGVVK